MLYFFLCVFRTLSLIQWVFAKTHSWHMMSHNVHTIFRFSYFHSSVCYGCAWIWFTILLITIILTNFQSGVIKVAPSKVCWRFFLFFFFSSDGSTLFWTPLSLLHISYKLHKTQWNTHALITNGKQFGGAAAAAVSAANSAVAFKAKILNARHRKKKRKSTISIELWRVFSPTGSLWIKNSLYSEL